MISSPYSSRKDNVGTTNKSIAARWIEAIRVS
jgi:hypothetical protein